MFIKVSKTMYLSIRGTTRIHRHHQQTTNQHPIFYKPDDLPIAQHLMGMSWNGLLRMVCRRTTRLHPRWLFFAVV